MKLISYRTPEGQGVAVGTDAGFVDSGYRSMRQLIRDGEAGLDRARAAVETGDVLAEPQLLAPLIPGKMYGTGINYRAHAEENPGFVAPVEPIVNFLKPSTAIVADGEAIVLPAADGLVRREGGFEVSYEVELGVVIGRTARHVTRANAMEHVFGYTIVNDLTSNAMIHPNNQLTLAKAFDTFAPIGPWIVTVDEIPDVRPLRLRCYVNGELLQDAVVADQIYPPDHLIAWLSGISTLEPGDLISTGTPPGTPFFATEPHWLTAGDVVRCEIDGIGAIQNPVIEMAAATAPSGPAPDHPGR